MPNEAGARIELARLVFHIRQLDERMMLAQRDRLRCRRRLTDVGPGSSSVVKVRIVSTSVFFGEPFRARQIRARCGCRPACICPVGLAQAIDHAVRVAHEERGGVDEHAIAFLRFDLEAPEHAPRERIVDRPALRVVRR